MDTPFLPRSAAQGVKTAIVSGLGPNGVLATLELLAAGFHVTVVEKRPAYTRPIHLHLRQSYLDEVRRLSPKLHARLMAIATPIERMERIRPGSVPVLTQQWPEADDSATVDDCEIRNRLLERPVAHVRLDSLECLFYKYVNGLTGLQYGLDPVHRLTVRRGFTLDLEADARDRFHASITPVDGDDPRGPEPESLGFPDLVVLAEGGKSSSVNKLGLASVKLSYPKYFMSAHVPVPFGPRTRRIDTDVRQVAPDAAAAEVSLWACGHGDDKQGTWIVLEVPAVIVETAKERAPEEAAAYFVNGAMVLLCTGDAARDAALRAKIHEEVVGRNLLGNARSLVTKELESDERTPFAGTFKFEQQCLTRPGIGSNVVVLGDSAGMGHHALSSGLEMGATDLKALRALAGALTHGEDAAAAVGHYANRVFRARMTLLSLGMREYYPLLDIDPIDLLHRAAELAKAGGAPSACAAFETLVESACGKAARTTNRSIAA